jgi:hypothetical protein
VNPCFEKKSAKRAVECVVEEPVRKAKFEPQDAANGWEELCQMFAITETRIKLQENNYGSEKCIFIPTKELIIQMIKAIISLKGKSED